LKNLAPAARGGQELNLDHHKSKFTKIPKKPIGLNHQKDLNELARKWVRYGCAETPNEAIKMLLEGQP